MGDIIGFNDLFSSVFETSTFRDMDVMIDRVLKGTTSTVAVVFDIKCLTRPYTTTLDRDSMDLYTRVQSQGIVTYILSWEPNTPENVAKETALLTSLGVADPIVILRDVDACPIRKKDLSWNAQLAAYNLSRVPNDRKVIMNVGRMWVDVLPPDLTDDCLPSTIADKHMLAYHTKTATWCLRMSPSRVIDV